MEDILGRVAIVTGAGSGLGKEFAKLWLAQGGAVVGVDIDQERLDWLAAEDHATVVGDVTHAETSDAAVAAALRTHGGVDALVLSAGLTAWGGIEDLDLATYDRVMEVNVRAAALSIRSTAPAMRERGGSIVLFSSSSGTGGEADHWAYCASKGAVTGLARSAAMDLARDGIRVNVVAPGPIHTEMTLPIRSSAPEKYEALRRAIPMQRWGEAREVAQVVAFLASSASSFVNAAVIPVDGGMTGRTAQFLPPMFDPPAAAVR